MLKDWVWENKGQSCDEPLVEYKKRLLEEIAYKLSCESKEVFTRWELCSEIDNFLETHKNFSPFRKYDSSSLIRELSEQDGILQKNVREGEEYLFLHRTFQEYFTACYLNWIIQKNQKQGIEFLRQHFWEYEWHETLRLLAGLTEDSTTFLQVLKNEKDDVFSSLLLLAGQCIVETRNLSQSLTQKIIDKIFEFWRSHPSIGFIKPTVIELCQVNSKMLEKLQEALNDKDSDVKQQASEILGEVGSSKAVLALIRVCDSEDVRVKNKAVQALAKINQTFNGKEALIQALSNESNDVKRLTAWVLSRIGNVESVTSLIQVLLKDDEDSQVKQQVALALGRIGNPEAVQPLTYILLKNDEDRQVKQQVALALGRIGNPEAVQPLTHILLKDDEDNQVQQCVAWALGRLGNSEAIEPLGNVLATSKDNRLRQRIISALGQIGEPKAVKTLIRYIRDSDPYVRKLAVIALGEIGDPRVVMGLNQALYENLDIKDEVVWALLQIGSPEALQAIPKDKKLMFSLSTDTDDCIIINDYIVDDYDYILDLEFSSADDFSQGEQKYTKDVETLIQELLYEDSSKARQKAAAALGKILRPEEVVVPLTQALLQDWDSTVREKVAEVLGQIHSFETVMSLTQALLMDQSAKVRIQAAKSLGQPYRNRSVLPLVHSLFQEKSIKVRQQIAEALGQIGNPEAVRPLILALNLKYQNSIVTALEKLGESADNMARAQKILGIKEKSDKNKFSRTKNDSWKYNSPDKVSELRKELLGKEVSFRRKKEIVKELGRIDDLSAVKPLIRAFIEEVGEISNLAEESLNKFSLLLKSNVESVLALNNDKNSQIRRQAVSNLSQVHNPEVIIILIHALIDKDWEVRKEIVEALGKIEANSIQQLLETLEALRQARNDKQIDVSREARKVLEKIISPQTLENLILALQDKKKTPYAKEQISRLLEEIGARETLKELLKLLKNNFDNHYIFSLTRTLSLRFIKEFGPVYPESVTSAR